MYVKSRRIAGRDWIAGLGLALILALSPAHAEEQPASEAAAANESPSGSDESAPSAPAEHIHLDPQALQLAVLAQQQHPPTQVLSLGEAEDAFLGLYVLHNTPQAMGGIVLVAEDGTHPDWPGPVQALRTGLADYGWQTLSIAIPPLPVHPHPKRDLPVLINPDEVTPAANEENSAAQDSAAPPVANPALPEGKPATAEAAPPSPSEPLGEEVVYAELINQRLQLAEDYLKARGLEKVVFIGVGTGASLAARYLAARADAELTLVMVNAKEAGDPEPIDLLSTLAGLDNPVLDLYLANQIQGAAKLRRDNARRYNRLSYEQLRLSPRPHHPAAEGKVLVQRIRGWLKTRQQERPVDLSANAAAT